MHKGSIIGVYMGIIQGLGFRASGYIWGLCWLTYRDWGVGCIGIRV